MTRSMSSDLRPQLETLECRTVPATASFSNGVLTITGYGGDNEITILDSGNGTVRAIIDGDDDITCSNVNRIEIDTQGGHDSVEYRQLGDRTLNVTLDIDLGSGSDDFKAWIGGNINAGKTLHIMVDGQTGDDDIWVDADQDVDIRSGATLKLDLDGGSGDDDIRSSYEGENDGKLVADYKLGTGLDSLYSWVTFNGGSSGTSSRTWSWVDWTDTDFRYVPPIRYVANSFDPLLL